MPASMCDATRVRAAHATLGDIPFERLQQRVVVSDEVFDDYLKFLAMKAGACDFFAALLSPPPPCDDRPSNNL